MLGLVVAVYSAACRRMVTDLVSTFAPLSGLSAGLFVDEDRYAYCCRDGRALELGGYGDAELFAFFGRS